VARLTEEQLRLFLAPGAPRRAKASAQQIQTIADLAAQRVLDLYDPHTYEGGDDIADED